MKKRTILLLLGALFLGIAGVKAMQNQGQEDQMKSKKEIYLAGGCFWGTQHYLKQIRGVLSTEVGYANGRGKNPDYKTVCTSQSGFAETVKVVYDPAVISLEKLLDLYYEMIDPTSHNKQGNDVGSQYRAGIFYSDKADQPIIKASLGRLATHYTEPITVECVPLKNYYRAEEYHQDYLDKNPGGYCHIPQQLFEKAKSANRSTTEPTAKKYVRMNQKDLKKKLTPMQYAVTQENGTERPFTNEYWNEFREGIYVDITTGEPLFVSTDKFESNCGWPSFSKPIDKSLVMEKNDLTHGMKRIEIRSKTGNAHLGHVFNDGPADKGGLRYCINSAALRFIPKEEMKKEGYGVYIKLIKK